MAATFVACVRTSFQGARNADDARRARSGRQLRGEPLDAALELPRALPRFGGVPGLFGETVVRQGEVDEVGDPSRHEDVPLGVDAGTEGDEVEPSDDQAVLLQRNAQDGPEAETQKRVVQAAQLLAGGDVVEEHEVPFPGQEIRIGQGNDVRNGNALRNGGVGPDADALAVRGDPAEDEGIVSEDGSGDLGDPVENVPDVEDVRQRGEKSVDGLQLTQLLHLGTKAQQLVLDDGGSPFSCVRHECDQAAIESIGPGRPR